MSNVDNVRRDYDAFAYGGGAVRQSHPARLAAVARLHGVATVDIRRAHVLELGCSHGGNLLPLAEQFPEASFVGIDFTLTEIEKAQRLAEDVGLTNISFIQADIREYEPEPGAFDYIIAHGLFSWVPDDAKAALLSLCSKALSPQGIAYISYNTYPGWKKRETMRDLLLMQTSGATTPREKLDSAGKTLAHVERLFAGQDDLHGKAIGEIVASIRKKPESVVYHDELGIINDPCYFLQFADWAAEFDLAYVGEAEFETLLAAQLQEKLDGISPDRLQREQWMDFRRDRLFRCTLLTHRDRVPVVSADSAVLREFVFGANFKPPMGLPNLSSDIEVSFESLTNNKRLAFRSKDPLVKVIYTILADAWPQRVSGTRLLEKSKRLLMASGVEVTSDFEKQMLLRLLDGCGRRFLDFSTDCGLSCATQVSQAPRVSRLNRKAAKQMGVVTTPWHDPVPIPAELQKLLPKLDGTRSNFDAGEKRHLEELAAAGLLLG